MMSKIAFLSCLLFICIKGFSQQEYFLYLQTEDRRPFYARVSDKMYSSSENGYLIISKLQDNKQELTIGFAKNEVPEQKFTIKPEKKNRGYLIRNLADKGWVLVNLQTSDLIPSSSREVVMVSEFTGNKKTDAFSEMLAGVVNDSAILYNAVRPKALVPVAENKSVAEVSSPVKDPVSTQPIESGEIKDSVTVASIAKEVAATPPLVKKDTTTSPALGASQTREDSSLVARTPQVVTTDTTTRQEPLQVVVAKTAVEKPFLTKLAELKTDNMYQAIYLELYNLTTDTIRIYIPFEDSSTSSTAASPASKKEKTPPTDSLPEPAVVVKSVTVQDTGVTNKPVPEILNSDCKNFATDHDLDKLRIRLIDDKTIDEKIASARKFFKAKCYSVSQIKALTELFPTDETKYRFFDTSYAFVSDTGKFFTLEEVFSNEFYKNKFKALIHK